MLFTPRTCLWCLPVCCPSCGLHTTTTCFISPQLVYAAIKNYFSPLSLLITKQPTLQPRLWRPPGCQQQCYQSHLRGAQQRSDYRGSFGSDCSDPLRPCRSFPKTHSVKQGFQWWRMDFRGWRVICENAQNNYEWCSALVHQKCFAWSLFRQPPLFIPLSLTLTHTFSLSMTSVSQKLQ